MRQFLRESWKATGLVVALWAPGALAGVNPFANQIMSFDAGTGAQTSYPDPNSVLGSPARYTGELFGFPGAVTPFNAPFDPDEVYSIGSGGHITVRFAQPVTNDPLNPYGIDLLVFGNSFFWDPINFEPRADAISADGGLIEVSPDNVTWTPVPALDADGMWPTLGYTDGNNPFGGPAGNAFTDFTKPVNPAFNWVGADYAQLIAGYDGSGGGAGVDIGALGLSQISYVRVSYTGAANVEIDAFSDVTAIPAPASVFALFGVFALSGRRR